MNALDRRAMLLRLGATAALAATAHAAAQPGNAPAPGTPATPPVPVPPPAAVPPAATQLMRPIPSSGEQIPVMGLGTSRTFDVGTTEEERAPIEEVITAFLTLGGKLIDTSPMYKRAEQVVGDITDKFKLRDKIFMATKVWTEGQQKGIEQMEDSMAKLHSDPIDLMQVHNLLDLEAHLATLREWKEKKRIRYIGVTHYTDANHDAIAEVIRKHKIDFIQINHSVKERNAEEKLFPLARDRGVAVIVNRPFAAGNLFKELLERPLPPIAKEIDCDSWAQLLLKYVISHPAVTCVIPATSKAKHLRDNMKAGVGRMPSEDQRREIVKAIA